MSCDLHVTFTLCQCVHISHMTLDVSLVPRPHNGVAWVRGYLNVHVIVRDYRTILILFNAHAAEQRSKRCPGQAPL